MTANDIIADLATQNYALRKENALLKQQLANLQPKEEDNANRPDNE